MDSGPGGRIALDLGRGAVFHPIYEEWTATDTFCGGTVRERLRKMKVYASWLL